MKSLGILLMLSSIACTNDQPCDGVASACVVVGVSSPQFAAIDELELDVSYGDVHETYTVVGATGTVTDLPVLTSIELAPEAPVILSVVGAGKLGGALLGVGFDETAPLLDGHRAMLALVLVQPAPCIIGGSYCGNTAFPGHEHSRYQCQEASVPTLIERCATSCVMVGGGRDTCE